MFDALGEILQSKKPNFSRILYDAWFALDVRNMSNEKKKIIFINSIKN